MNAPNAAQSLTPADHRPPKPTTGVDPLYVLAWLDEDRILLKDRTRLGLHRRVIARKGDMPDAEVWVSAVAIADKIDRDRITHRYTRYGEYWYLWIFWKDKK